ncbi:MAG: S46 family peptidase, partial [Gemmatimonadetes bacterium]|nr:S46 family peptidase [Gemmatimonadota bacterium]
PGESLLDNGFYATSLEEERPVANFYADQLIAALDVSDEVLRAVDPGRDEAERARLRDEAAQRVQARLLEQHAGRANRVEVVPLYNGGRYSAYVFRRYTNVRLVAATELQLGFFGGDPDNFTYPRYALDFAFLRIYDDAGQPLRAGHYFTWSERGVEEGEAVFVIGNPGPTNRLNTMAQLEFQRDVLVPALEHAFDMRLAALWEFYRENPSEGDRLDIRNKAFRLSNSLKAYTGRLAALRDPDIMARKRGAERGLRDSIAARPALRRRYGDVIDRIAALQRERAPLAASYGAFVLFGNATYGSATLRRAMAALDLLQASARGAPADSVAALRQRLLAIEDHPASLEQRLLRVRLDDFGRYFGADKLIVRTALPGGISPPAAAERVLQGSALATAQRTAAALEAGSLTREDPAIRLAAAIQPHFARYNAELQRIGTAEADLASRLGRVRFDIYGTAVPPDGSSSPRITDGVVRGYPYNGTLAPPYTTFFGMYDRHYAFGQETDWALPARWLPPPRELDLGTPLNFVSTADTYGGNSGSPAVTARLELVGLNFDRNVEGLSRDFIYLPQRGRNIMVDVRAIREALADVYDLDRIALEVLTHRLYATEAEADAAGR